MPLYGGQETPLAGGIVLYEKLADKGVAVVTMNIPDRMNGITDALTNAVWDGFDMARDDGDVKVILFTGAGRAFSAGADMGGLAGAANAGGLDAGAAAPQTEEQKAKAAARAADRAQGIVNDGKKRPSNYPLHIPKPIIACVNGACAGVGMSTAMNCDIRFAAEGANFSAAFPRRGLIAEWGISWTLPRVAGVGNAMDILLSGRKFDAHEAQQLGMVQRVFPKDQLMSQAIDYAADMAANVPSNSMATIKAQVLTHQHRDSESALRESNRLMLMSTTKENPDFAEGVSSYVQKRAPKFNALNPDSPMQKLTTNLLRQGSKL